MTLLNFSVGFGDTDMILFGAEHERPVNVHSVLMECLSNVIMETPIARLAGNETPIKVSK